ncbi:MAG: M15 family metallopeptidase [Chlamydiales bacterium]
MSKRRDLKLFQLPDLLHIPSSENGEDFVDLSLVFPDIHAECHRLEYPLELRKILVRQVVALKLVHIQEKLFKFFPGYQLRVVEGYRHPKYQKKYFEEQFLDLKIKFPKLSSEELDVLTHQYIAHPDVAGHPTGGAVDLTLQFNGTPIDMGSQIADFSDPEKMPTFSHSLTALQQNNRILLHDLMIAEGFAPFYGEWWHFSYGDREWAAFYENPTAIYDAKILEFEC